MQRTISDTKTIFKHCLNAQLGQPRVDFWATSMDQNRLYTYNR